MMSNKDNMSRRDFIKLSATTGTALVIGIYLSGCSDTSPEPTVTHISSPVPTDTTEATPEPTSTPQPTPATDVVFEPNIYLTIDQTGLVTIVAFRTEMGQGIRTAIAMILSEELDVDWSMVQIEQTPANIAYGDQSTGGSASVSEHYGILRRAGAMTRQMLITAAAQIWDVGETECITENGSVIHEPTGQRLTYGELVEPANSVPEPLRRNTFLKNPESFRLIGTRKGHYDSLSIVDGSAIFGIDIKVPGMLYATVMQGPVFGSDVVSINAAAAEGVEGVQQVVEISSGVAVVAESTWGAFLGKRALEVTWEEGSGAGISSETILDAFNEEAESYVAALGDENLVASYLNPFLAHATLEPMNCVADVRDQRCDIWAPTQNPQEAMREAARVTGLPADSVTVNVPLVGGGFGRRLEVDYVVQAVEISQEVGAPIQLVWTREEDIQHDFYHPMSLQFAHTELDSPGRPRIRTYDFSFHVPVGAWRSVGNFTEALARESYLDELAHELDRDPLELRLELLPQSHIGVLELVAEKSNWGASLPVGWGRGIACFSTFSVTPVAQVAEISVDENGVVRVHRVVCAVDCGTVVNPDTVEAQMEGGIAFGLTAALKAEITIEDGHVLQSNFHDYPLLTMDEMPLVETHIVQSDRQPTGIGEMGVPPITPAVLNAVFDATGVRIRKIPIKPEDLRS
jgi:isoquinoline 1-oxidoreductase beta subunit